MNLGEQIYKLRTAHNLSQGDLADALDVSRQSVSKWENNSAVPELDKLLKMAQIFEITLDELVTGAVRTQAESDTEAPPAAAPVQFVAAMPITQERYPARKIVGIILMTFGLLCLLVCMIVGIVTGNRYAHDLLAVGGIIALPLALIGLCCLCLRYPQLFCGWVTWAALVVYVFMLTPRWEDEGLLLWLVVLTLAAMLVWTVWAIRSKRVYIPLWLLIIGGLVLAFLAVLFAVNAMPPFEVPVEQRPVEIIPAGSIKVP